MMSEYLWLVGVMTIVVAVSFGMESVSCDAQAKAMGFPSSYGPVQGCLIEPHPGDWIPLKNYRGL